MQGHKGGVCVEGGVGKRQTWPASSRTAWCRRRRRVRAPPREERKGNDLRGMKFLLAPLLAELGPISSPTPTALLYMYARWRGQGQGGSS